MNKALIWILLLTIWNSILFFGKELGISVILFIIPLLIFIYYVLKSNDLIKNKKGLLFIIPIILLSLTYFIFNNEFFNTLNAPIINILFALMYTYTINPTFNIQNILSSIASIFIKPISLIPNILNLVKLRLKGRIRVSDKFLKVLKSIIIILPVVIVVLALLSSADLIFENIFSKMFGIFENFSLASFIGECFDRLIPMLILFFYLAATINYLLNGYLKTKLEDKKIELPIDHFTIKLLLTVLNIIYIVFDVIQIRSLLLHQVSMDISYAEYARQGFFQLMFVSFINIIIIFISKLLDDDKDIKSSKYIKIMNIIMVFLTFIIIISSFIRMNMYESEFGYTLLRLLVYITLITEVILLIPTVIYILNSKFNVVKHYLIILVSVYTIINFINVDYIIAYRNVERYYKVDDIDIEYLKNGRTDNIPVLIDLYNKTDDTKIKRELRNYFYELDTKTTSYQEFNISKYLANKEIKALKK